MLSNWDILQIRPLKMRTWLNQIRIVSFLAHLYTLHIISIQIFFFLSQSSNKWYLVFKRVFTLLPLSHYFKWFKTFQLQLKLWLLLSNRTSWEYHNYGFPVTRGSFIGHCSFIITNSARLESWQYSIVDITTISDYTGSGHIVLDVSPQCGMCDWGDRVTS